MNEYEIIAYVSKIIKQQTAKPKKYSFAIQELKTNLIGVCDTQKTCQVMDDFIKKYSNK